MIHSFGTTKVIIFSCTLILSFCVWLPDWCSPSGGDGAQDSGVDINAFITKPSAASTAAVFRYQGSIQTHWGPQPQQECEWCPSALTWKTRTFLGLHSLRGQRGTRGQLNDVCTLDWAHSCFRSLLSRFPSVSTNLSLTSSSSWSLVSLLLSVCCSCCPLSDTFPGPWSFCLDDLWPLLAWLKWGTKLDSSQVNAGPDQCLWSRC